MSAPTRSTKQRTAIAALLTNVEEFRSAQELHDELRRGRALSDALSDAHWIAPTHLNLLRVGERSGQLPAMLTRLGHIATEQARLRMKRLLQLIEPLAILVIGGIIGFIMVAVILAITSLNTAKL